MDITYTYSPYALHPSQCLIWLYIDYSTMRVHDLFVTDYEYKLIKDIEKTYINVSDEEYASTKATRNPIENLEITEKEVEEMKF